MAKGKTKWKTGICDVHRLVDNDVKRRNVFYCPDCDALLCRSCAKNKPKRAYAMTLRNLQRLNKDFKKEITLKELFGL